MLSNGAGIFINVPSESGERVLRPATIVEKSNDGLLIRLDDHDPTPEPSEDVFVYHTVNNEFMQQPARVTAVHDGDEGPTLGIEITGKPVSAESRQCYRVGTLTSGLTAKFGPEENCPLIDVSLTGLSLMCDQIYQVGDTVNVSVSHNGKTWSGQVRVQGARELPNGRMRYGLHCLDEREKGGELGKGLQQISMAIQRTQLRRLAGGA